MATLNQVTPNRGSDVPFQLLCKDADGDAVDLFGYTVQAIDVSTALASYLSVSVSDPANGIVTGRIEWHTSLLANTPYRFRLQLTSGDDDFSTPLIEVKYQ